MAVATADDIVAGTREALIVSWSDPAILALFPSARDGQAEPSEGFCDLGSDAQAVVDQRGALIGAIGRRRFTVVIASVIWIEDLPTNGNSEMPCVTLIDDEQTVSGTFIVSRCEVDLETETTTLELFG